MKIRWLFRLSLLVLFAFLLIGCGSSGGGGSDSGASSDTSIDTDSDAKEITTFSFMAADNNELTSDVTGTISETNITAVVPGGTDVSALVATFTFDGDSLKVNGITQTSGISVNDYSSDVIYTVTADDDTTQDYIVSVSISDVNFIEITESETITLDDGSEVVAAKDEILVYLNEDITTTQLDNIYNSIIDLGGEVKAFDPELRILQVNVDSSDSEIAFSEELTGKEGISGAGLNLAVSYEYDNEKGYTEFVKKISQLGKDDQNFSAPSKLLDTSITPTFSVSPSEFTGDYWIDHISVQAAWDAISDLTLGNVTIGIVDTGISSEQNVISEDRLQRYKSNGVEITDDDTKDEKDHGLNVTAFAAGFSDETSSVYGVNHHSDVIMVDVLKKIPLLSITFTSDLVGGIKTAIDKGADVINVSIGDGSDCDDEQEKRLESRREWRSSISSAVNYARRQGRLLVFSAGNNCEKADNQYLPETDDLNVDAWNSHALIVAASNDQKTDTWFSRMGDIVSLAAPGEEVGYGNSDVMDGTSFSAPMVTGAAALVKEINTTLETPEIRHIITENADNSLTLHPFTPEDTTGPNKLLNVSNSINTAQLTTGISIDEYEAIELAKNNSMDVTVSITIPEETVNSLDVLFLIDVSGSYYDDINTLQEKAAEIISNLQGTVTDVQFAVASFSDFPLSDFGSTGDNAYQIRQTMTANVDSVEAAIGDLDNPMQYGNDTPESQLEALYQAATGLGRDINEDGNFTDDGELSPASIGWRTGALKVILFATDAAFHDSDTESEYPGSGMTDTISALQNANIVVYGLQSGDESDAYDDITAITSATDGELYQLSSDSSEIVQGISDGLDSALEELDITLKTIAGGEWITNISPASHDNITSGQTVDFTVSLEGQKSSSIDELSYDIYLWGMGDGSAILKRIKLPITVP